jgi:hypothetical protein
LTLPAASDATKGGPLSEVHFIRLALKSADGKTISTNFYWRGREEWSYEALEHMPRAAVSVTPRESGETRLAVDLENTSSAIALMLRLKLIDSETGLLLAPVLYSDNYVSLVPGERVSIDIDLSRVPRRGAARLVVEGWNTPAVERVESTRRIL